MGIVEQLRAPCGQAVNLIVRTYEDGREEKFDPLRIRAADQIDFLTSRVSELERENLELEEEARRANVATEPDGKAYFTKYAEAHDEIKRLTARVTELEGKCPCCLTAQQALEVLAERDGLRKELNSWHEEYCGCKEGITDHLSYCLSLGLPHDCHHLLGTKSR